MYLITLKKEVLKSVLFRAVGARVLLFYPDIVEVSVARDNSMPKGGIEMPVVFFPLAVR